MGYMHVMCHVRKCVCVLALIILQQLTSNDSPVIALAFYQQLTIQAKKVPDEVSENCITIM